MKIVKVALFAVLFLMLSSSQAVAVSNVNSVITPNALNDNAAPNVLVTWVGTGPLTADEVALSEYGTYDVVTTTGNNNMLVKLNASGFEMYSDSLNASGYQTGGDTFKMIGTLYCIIDGNMFESSGFTASAGSNVALQGLGDHTVTFLYVIRTESGSLKYDSETIVIRTHSTDDFAAMNVRDFDLEYDVTDSAVAGEQIDMANVDVDYSRNVSILEDVRTKQDFSVEAVVNDGFLQAKNFHSAVKISGTIDTTGSADFDLLNPVTSTVGNVFLIDATGAHLMSDSVNTVAVRMSDTFVGLLVLSDAGYLIDNSEPDFEGLVTGGMGYNGSIDFWGVLDGATLGDLVFSTEVDTPGFSGMNAALGLLSLGIIAFVIPRRYKKN
jgi:hypothetical protein